MKECDAESVPLSRSSKSFNIKLVMQMLRGKNWKMSLEKRVNKKVLTMFEKAEDEYNDLLSKKNIIENDQSKIKKVIEELDEKKKETLKVTCVKLNK
ncbi:structural maintenance of chromosomes protein 2-2-like [Magnolia sinica]|uniref:structural maintenance of chromosomes protein 2-2-like n=1 Tax=Magnolia sinica TaxID=86752 RepID=UPI002659EB53|nr:structural maintenance of chromosomes protein 2-2-like [Magnolia sinica]